MEILRPWLDWNPEIRLRGCGKTPGINGEWKKARKPLKRRRKEEMGKEGMGKEERGSEEKRRREKKRQEVVDKGRGGGGEMVEDGGGKIQLSCSRRVLITISRSRGIPTANNQSAIPLRSLPYSLESRYLLSFLLFSFISSYFSSFSSFITPLCCYSSRQFDKVPILPKNRLKRYSISRTHFSTSNRQRQSLK